MKLLSLFFPELIIISFIISVIWNSCWVKWFRSTVHPACTSQFRIWKTWQQHFQISNWIRWGMNMKVLLKPSWFLSFFLVNYSLLTDINYNFLFLKGTAKDEITIEEPYTYRKGELPMIREWTLSLFNCIKLLCRAFIKLEKWIQLAEGKGFEINWPVL